MNTVATAALPAAGFWRRYAAWSLDFAVLATFAALLTWRQLITGWHATAVATAQLVSRLGQSMADALLAGIPLPQLLQSLLPDPASQAAAAAIQSGLERMLLPWLLAYALLAAAWHVGGEVSRWQGSPGKHALALRVTDLHGRPSTLARAATRYVASALSWLTLNLGHAMAAVPPHKRALHDHVAGTRVACSDDQANLPGWASAWIALQVVAGVALVAWLLLRYVAALQAATFAG